MLIAKGRPCLRQSSKYLIVYHSPYLVSVRSGYLSTRHVSLRAVLLSLDEDDVLVTYAPVLKYALVLVVVWHDDSSLMERTGASVSFEVVDPSHEMVVSMEGTGVLVSFEVEGSMVAMVLSVCG